MTTPSVPTTAGKTLRQAQGKTLQGTVVKTAMKDTATVEVSRYEQHPKYKKFIKKSKKFFVHDPGNTLGVGDKVVMRETRPISKNKHFIVVSRTQAPKVEE